MQKLHHIQCFDMVLYSQYVFEKVQTKERRKIYCLTEVTQAIWHKCLFVDHISDTSFDYTHKSFV